MFEEYKLPPWIQIDKIYWDELSNNPNAIHLLEKIQIYWDNLSQNPNAIHLLEKTQDKIDWIGLLSNQSIFYELYNYEKISYNYEKIKTTIGDKIREELIKKLYVPKRVEFMVNTYYDEDFELYWSNTPL
jgi:hypothetical protein